MPNPEPVKLFGRMLNLDKLGNPFKPGTLITADDTHTYIVEASGVHRRIQVVEQTKDGVRYQHIRSMTKAEKKALKRQRAKARARVEEAAIHVARRTLQAQEAHA